MSPPPSDDAGDAARATADVRMRGFRARTSVADALAAALDGLTPRVEHVGIEEAAGRVLLQSVDAEADVPGFRRSAMDGYAVRAADTFGASLYAPVRLALVGESMPGGDGGPRVPAGGACRIMTGAPVPDGADAVLKAEAAREEGAFVEALEALPPEKNIGRVGEDVARGTRLFDVGRRLRPQDAALLASVGVGSVSVAARPRVRVITTGNELLPPGAQPSGHRIVDSNSILLAALVRRDGGELERSLRLRDERGRIEQALLEPGADVVLTVGGTSVGREDYVPLLVREHGRLEVHGVSMRPSSPTGIGRLGAARVVLLPGNPVSCLAAYDVFAGPVIRVLGGRSAAWPYVRVRRRLAGRLVSQIGRTDYARLAEGPRSGTVTPLAVAGASVLSSTTRAVGFALVPAGSEGHAEGEEIDVFLYDPPAEGAVS